MSARAAADTPGATERTPRPSAAPPEPADRREADERYQALLRHARRVATRIVAASAPAPITSAGRYLLRQSRLLSSTGLGGRDGSAGIGADALDLVDRGGR